MLKWIIILILMLPFVSSVLVEVSDDNISWTNISQINEATNETYQLNLQPQTLYYFRARNSSTDSWQYLQQRTKSGGEGIMATLAVTLFMMTLTGIIFIMGAKGHFFDRNEVANFIIRRSIYIVGLWFIVIDITILLTISENFGLGISGELFNLLWFAHKGAWLFSAITLWSTVYQSFKLYKVKEEHIRSGDDE